MFLCQHLGVAPARKRGCIREIRYQIPHISPPTLSTSAKVAKQGAYMRDATVCKMSLKSPIYSVEIVLEGNNGFCFAAS